MNNKYSRLQSLLFLFSETDDTQIAAIVSQLREFFNEDIFELFDKLLKSEIVTQREQLPLITAKLVVHNIIPGEKAVEYLKRLCDDTSANVKRAVLSAVPYMYEKSNNAVKQLIEAEPALKRFIDTSEYDDLLHSLDTETNTFVISRLVIQIADYKDPSGIEHISKHLKSSDSRVRANCCEALDKYRDQEIAYFIIPLINDPVQRVKNAVLAVLKKRDRKEVIDAAQLLISRKLKLEAAMLSICRFAGDDAARMLKSYLSHSDTVIRRTAAQILEQYLKEHDLAEYVQHVLKYNKDIQKYTGIAAAVVLVLGIFSYMFSGEGTSSNAITYFSKKPDRNAGAQIDIDAVAKTEKDRKVLQYLEKAVVKEPDTPKFPPHTPRQLKQIIIAETHPDIKKAAFSIAKGDLSSAKAVLENLLRKAGDNTYLHLQTLAALMHVAEFQNDMDMFREYKEQFLKMSNRSKLETMNEDFNLSSNEFEQVLDMVNKETIKAFSGSSRSN